MPLILSAGITACSDEGRDPTVPAGTEVSFAADIQPIFDARCTVCHGVGGNGGLNLLPGASYANLVNVTASGYAAKRIAPNDSDNSVLYGKVSDTGIYGGRMPAAGDPLTDEQIANIRTWIQQGAPDN